MSGSIGTGEGGSLDPKMAELLNTPQGQQIAAMLASGQAAGSQRQRNPYDLQNVAMQRYAQQGAQGISPPTLRPQVKGGQAVAVASPYEELMKLQQMQQMRQRPASLL
jgi:hypothetical protein